MDDTKEPTPLTTEAIKEIAGVEDELQELATKISQDIPEEERTRLIEQYEQTKDKPWYSATQLH